MEKGYINVDENEINSITSHLDKNMANIEDVGTNSKNTLRSLTNANLFGTGLKKITNQVTSISKTIGRVNQTIKKQTSEMMMLDENLSKKAEKINIPMDFVRNNSIRNHMFDDIVLNKKDGKQVNDDGYLNKKELQMDSEAIAINLKDMTIGAKDFTNKNLKEYKEKKSMLKNINNNQITQTKELNFMEDGIVSSIMKNDITTENEQDMSNINTVLEELDMNEKNIVDEYFYDDFFDDNYY